jgi:hypothetical protein
MATSPNFSWPEPDNTDLVKNGALAIRTAVDAIDSSMADLKGGTTGQVLAKASNTDMDFSWVAQDDSNAIQNAIVDAKGDLIAATANDTPARLAVGADYGFLQALASESTGLKWDSGAWTAYTPTLSAGSGSFTTATTTGAYKRIGKVCITRVQAVITVNGTAAGQILITTPFTSTGAAQGTWREVNATAFGGIIYTTGTTQFGLTNNDGTYPGANLRNFQATIVFEVA